MWLRERWPVVRKRAAPQCLELFQNESGVSQRASIRRTWATKGETPVLIHAFNWSKMSVCAAIGCRWDGRRSRLFFQTREGSSNTESLLHSLAAATERAKSAIRGRQDPRAVSILKGHTEPCTHARGKPRGSRAPGRIECGEAPTACPHHNLLNLAAGWWKSE